MAPDQEFSAVDEARRILRLAAAGSLATLSADGSPFASLVTVATTAESEPVLLLSNLAVHTRNLRRDPRASLLLVGPGGEGGDPLAGARLTVGGRIAQDDDPASRRRFLARHREAAGYAGFGDFAVYRLDVTGAHLVAGFGRIVTLGREDLLTDCREAGELVAAEDSALDHMNADHAEAVRLYATRLLGLPDGAWIVTGIDPDGLDMRLDGMRGRLPFAEPLTSPGALRRMLAGLADEARRR